MAWKQERALAHIHTMMIENKQRIPMNNNLRVSKNEKWLKDMNKTSSNEI